MHVRLFDLPIDGYYMQIYAAWAVVVISGIINVDFPSSKKREQLQELITEIRGLN